MNGILVSEDQDGVDSVIPVGKEAESQAYSQDRSGRNEQDYTDSEHELDAASSAKSVSQKTLNEDDSSKFSKRAGQSDLI